MRYFEESLSREIGFANTAPVCNRSALRVLDTSDSDRQRTVDIETQYHLSSRPVISNYPLYDSRSNRRFT